MRTGNLQLYMESMKRMLPFFPAAGHNSYANSLYIYLQQLSDMATSNPNLYNLFEKGLFVARRTDNSWTGISCDLAIEQVLMGSLQNKGGLAKRHGMNEGQRQVWVKAMVPCSEVTESMQAFTATRLEGNEKTHKENSVSRKTRNHSDLKKLLAFLIDHNPFEGSNQLRNIVTGMLIRIFYYNCKEIDSQVNFKHSFKQSN